MQPGPLLKCPDLRVGQIADGSRHHQSCSMGWPPLVPAVVDSKIKAYFEQFSTSIRWLTDWPRLFRKPNCGQQPLKGAKSKWGKVLQHKRVTSKSSIHIWDARIYFQLESCAADDFCNRYLQPFNLEHRTILGKCGKSLISFGECLAMIPQTAYLMNTDAHQGNVRICKQFSLYQI